MKVLPGAALLLWPMAVAWADPATVDVFANSRYSDNINKREENTEEEFEDRVGIGISKITRPGTCEGSLNGDVAFVTYRNDTNDDEFSGTVDANGVCEPNRNFRWSARDTLRDVRTTTQAADSPANRERRNVFSTGPTFTIHPGRRDNLSLDVEYQMTRFQESTDDDSDRLTTTGRWQHLFTSTLNGGLAVSRSDIEFRQTDEELTRDNANAFFSWQRPNGQWSGELGYSWLESERGVVINETNGLTGRLRYSHQWDAGTSAFGEVRRSITDVSTDLDVRIPGLDLNLTETSAVIVTAVTAGISQQWTARTSSDASFSGIQQEFDRAGITEERFSMGLGVNHRISDNFSGRASTGYVREDFGTGVDPVGTARAELGVDYQRTRDLSFNAGIGHEIRDVVGGPGNEYHENWAQIGVRYNLR
ncbi:outer membrane beta-barrel protein [Halospina denitrificans]|uniref:outer membrane beta-barrel protein n=1 Tax=Halospina denitrificans TaxID=332522 RepID=UPI001414DE3D|nr:outer membrane beta-barrel protein [Halospina denitrificans]